MLEFFREKVQGAFAFKAIVVFFCAVFALWGVEALFDGNAQKGAVATVNGNDITEPELANAIKMLREQYIRMLGGQVDAKFLNDKMLRDPALESLISRKVLEDFITETKMSVGKKTIDAVIVADKTFSRDGKTFDADFYKERLRESGLTAAAYQNYLGKQMLLQYLQSGIAGSAFVTDAEIRSIAKLMAQKRSFEYVLFPLQKFAAEVQVSDDAVEKYYKEHQAEYMNDEQVAIDYLEINKKALADSVKVDESDIREAYDKEVAMFKPSTERSAAHILVETTADGSHEAKLTEIQDRLKKGEKFEELAKSFSVDEGSAAQGGDVGFTSGETFVAEFEKALAGLAAVGDVSAPVKTEFGYHIIKLTGKRDTAVKSFDERKVDIEQELRVSQAATLFSEKVDALAESTYSAGDLTAPAKELGLAVQKTAPFTRRGGAGIAGDQKVIEAAFAADMVESGKNSQLIELPGDKAIVLRVSEHALPKVRELAEVKAVISEKVRAELASSQLKEKIDQITPGFESAKSLDSVAQAEKLEVISVVDKKRQDAKDEQKDLFAAAFSMAKPAKESVSLKVIQIPSGDWVFIKLNNVEEVNVTDDLQEYVDTKKRLTESAGNSEFSLLERQLQKKAVITRKENKPEIEQQ